MSDEDYDEMLEDEKEVVDFERDQKEGLTGPCEGPHCGMEDRLIWVGDKRLCSRCCEICCENCGKSLLMKELEREETMCAQCKAEL